MKLTSKIIAVVLLFASFSVFAGQKPVNQRFHDLRLKLWYQGLESSVQPVEVLEIIEKEPEEEYMSEEIARALYVYEYQAHRP